MRPVLFLLLAACTGDKDTQPADTGPSQDTASGDTGAEDTPHADAVAALREAVAQDLRRANASGASVAIWLEGEVVFAEGFGSRHPDKESPVDPTTLFQIGSDSKKIAALAALQQVEAGRLSLDDTLADVVPELTFSKEPGLAGELTLHELLSHQSALFDYTPWTHAPDDSELHDRAVGRFAENAYTLGPSGLFWNYSNPNFSLAGLMTQEVDGRMWPDIIEDDIFAPLGMTRSFARLEDVIADGDSAAGYGISFEGGHDSFDITGSGPEYTIGTVETADQYDDAFTRPAGLIWSTATDMAILAGFLVDGDPSVLSDALRQQLTTSHVPLYPATETTDLGYGYGLMVNGHGFSGREGFYAVPFWAHGGNTMTMTSTFYVLPEQRMAVAILSNGYGDDFSGTAATAMENFAELPTPTTGTTFLQEPENVAALAGEWGDDDALGALYLTWEDDALQVSAPDLEKLGWGVGDTLQPYYRDMYLIRVDGQNTDLNRYELDGTEWLVNRSFSFVKDGDITTAVAPPASAAAGRSPLLSLDPRRSVERLMPTR